LQLANTYQHIAAELRDQTRRYCGHLVEKCDLNGCSVRRRFWDAAKPWEGIAEIAEEERADLIVVATRGRTAAAALFLGSVTERLIAATAVPLLAVKKKGAGLRLLDVLLGA
jgi:nucleotide-binding universal stress UspA family protein